MACTCSQTALPTNPHPTPSKNKTSTITAFGYLLQITHCKSQKLYKTCVHKQHYRFSSNIERLTMRMSYNRNHNLKTNDKKPFFFLQRLNFKTVEISTAKKSGFLLNRNENVGQPYHVVVRREVRRYPRYVDEWRLRTRLEEFLTLQQQSPRYPFVLENDLDWLNEAFWRRWKDSRRYHSSAG